MSEKQKRKNKTPLFQTLTCPECGHKFVRASAFPLGKKDRKLYEELIESPLVKELLIEMSPFLKKRLKRDIVDRDLLPIAIIINKDYTLAEKIWNKLTDTGKLYNQGIAPEEFVEIMERKHEDRKRLSNSINS